MRPNDNCADKEDAISINSRAFIGARNHDGECGIYGGCECRRRRAHVGSARESCVRCAVVAFMFELVVMIVTLNANKRGAAAERAAETPRTAPKTLQQLNYLSFLVE